MMITTFLERRSCNQPAKMASVAAVVAAAVLAMGPAQAQVTWDSSFSTSGPQDGAGTWSTLASGTNWWDGTTNVAWPSGNIATFGAGGTAGTVTVSGSVNAGGLTFGSLGSGTYTLSGGTIGLTAGGTISAATTFTLNSTLSGSNITLLWTTGTGVIGSVGSTSNALSGTFAVRTNGATSPLTLPGITSQRLGSATLDIGNNVTWEGPNGTFSNNLVLSGVGNPANVRGAMRIVANGTATGSVTLAGDATIWGNSGGSVSFTQGIGETVGGPKNLTLQNNGTSTFLGASTYSGTTIIEGGFVALDGGNDRLPVTTIADFNFGKLVLGRTSAITQTLAGINVRNGPNRGAVVGGASGTSTLNLAIASGTSTYQGMLGGTAANENNLALTKSGAGVLRLTGTSYTYTGDTTIAGGTLAIGVATATFPNSGVVRIGNAGSSGAMLDLTALTGTYTFGSNQTVGGIGTINFGAGKTVASQGIWAPGNSIGSNAVTGNLTLSGTSQFELGTPGSSASSPGTSDFTSVSGTLTLGGNLALLDNSGSNSQGSYGAGAYRLFTAPTVNGTFASVTAPVGATTTRVGMVYGSGTGSGQGVFANVYNLASATSSQTVNVGSTRVGSAATAAVSLANAAPSNATFTETLSTGGFSATTAGFTASGSASGIAGGGSGSGTLLVGLGSGLAAGVQTGTTTLALFTNAVNGSGLAQQAIATQTVTITGTVWNPAAANVLSGSIGLGSVIKGASFGSFSQALSITNTAPGGFSEKLDASFGTLTGVTTNSGSISLLDPGATNGSALVVGFDTSTAGAKSGAAEIRFSTNGAGTSGLGIAALSPQTVNFTGTVLDHSLPGFAGVPDPLAETTLALDFGSVNDSAGLQTRTFSLTNLFDALVGANLTAGLALTGTATGTGAFSLSGAGFSNLAAGGTSSLFTVSFTPSAQGTFTQQFTLSFADTQSLAGAAARRDLTVGATVIVVPEPPALVLSSCALAAASWMTWRRRRLPT